MQSEVESLKKLCNPKSGVSSHFFIKRSGKILNLVPEEKIAWHAGKSKWGKFNSPLIGYHQSQNSATAIAIAKTKILKNSQNSQKLSISQISQNSQNSQKLSKLSKLLKLLKTPKTL